MKVTELRIGLETKLKLKTDEMFKTQTNQSHKRSRLVFEMKEIYREINKLKNNL